MAMKAVFIAALMTLVMMTMMMMGSTEGASVLSNDPPTNTTTTTTTPTPVVCPPLVFVAKDGHCEFVNDKIKEKVATQIKKRNLLTATCPYCARGVYDAYPDWKNCSRFNYCLDGRIIPLSCRDLGASYFNPFLKACQLFDSPQNMCIHRSVSLLDLNQS